MDIGAAVHELGVDHQFAVQCNVGVDAFNRSFCQCRAHAGQGLFTRVTVHDDLADHGVVVRRHKVIGVNMRIHAHARAAGHVPGGDPAGRRDKLVRVFGIDTALDGVAFDFDLALRERQLFTGRHLDLGFDDVHACHPFRDRMLDLHTGVHLDEIKLTVFVQKLKSAGTAVADFLDGCHATVSNFLNQLARDAGRRRLLNHFLVTPLHRTVTLAQPNRIFMLIGHDLNFDMARVLKVLFHVHGGVAECSAGFGLGGLHRMDQGRLRVHDTHAAPAAAAGRLDDDRVADGFGRALDDDGIVRQSPFGAGHARHTGLDHGLFGGHLVTHDADRLRRGADELEAASLHPFGKVGVLAQKTVAGVNGFGVGHLGRRDDGRHVEITQCRRRGADADGLVSQLDVLGFAVRLRVDHHGLDTQFTAGALDPQGDLAPVGNQYLFEHGAGITRSSAWAVRTPRPDRFRTGWR